MGLSAQVRLATANFMRTGTVGSTPLIASSMSKKFASGADAIVLDVKVDYGAFVPNVEAARELVHLMVDIGMRVGKQMTALISDMNQPLGNAVGSVLGVHEAIETLHGRGPEDLKEHCLIVASHMLRLAGKSKETALSDVLPSLEKGLANGNAWRVFRTLVEAQGGDVSQIDHPEMLPVAPVIRETTAHETGTISEINAREIGLAALDLGAGQLKKTLRLITL